MNTEVKSSYCIYEAANFFKESLPWYIKKAFSRQSSFRLGMKLWLGREWRYICWTEKNCVSTSFPRASEVVFHCSPSCAFCLCGILTLYQDLLPSLPFSVYLNLLSPTRSPIIGGTNLSERQVQTKRLSKWGKERMGEQPFHLECLPLNVHVSGSMFSEQTVEWLVRSLLFSFWESLIYCF